jgi:hypothetical protein
MARPVRSGGTSAPATANAAPMNRPCSEPATNRAARKNAALDVTSGAAVAADCQRRQDGPACGDAERVRGHRRTGGAHRDVQVGGDQVDHPDDEQLGAAHHERGREQRRQRRTGSGLHVRPLILLGIVP